MRIDRFRQRRAILSALAYAAAAAACGGGSGGGQLPPPPASGRFRLDLVLPGAGETALVPVAIANGGQVAGYQADAEWGADAVAVVVESGSAQLLSVALQIRSLAMGISAQGTTIVGEHGSQPYAWTAAGPHVLAVPSGFFSGRALAVNTGGRIVGSWADEDDVIPPDPIGPRPCTWASLGSAAAPLATVDAAHPVGAAFDINDGGVIVGAVTTAAGFRAARWASATAAVETFAHLPGGLLSEGWAINNVGEIVGRTGFAGGESRAFILRAGSDAAERLPSLPSPAPYAEALDINDAGIIVGHSIANDGNRHAVTWRDGAVMDLNTLVDNPDARVMYLENAVGISATGSIAVLARLSAASAPRTHALAVLTPVS